MSLIDSMMEDFRIITEASVSDGAGGKTTTITEGNKFKAVITLDTSTEAQIAEKQGVTSVYTVTTSKGIVLNYKDIIKRVSDSRYFRITSDGADKYSPAISSLDMRQVKAEKWEVRNP